ncbi:hypothetical protein PR048_009609 [Dryococelus australis]|uniref:Uncharacterized protein n=1 Tax=Dryococelus australis TaxID=614101 RepID=A0ABQ9I0C6_9NEOP|nr:hypothetical protein PR048_009609 [Dryococelus australis]
MTQVAFSRAFSLRKIASGFNSTGIFPLYPGVLSDDDFLASYVTERNPEVTNLITASLPDSSPPEQENTSLECGTVKL